MSGREFGGVLLFGEWSTLGSEAGDCSARVLPQGRIGGSVKLADKVLQALRCLRGRSSDVRVSSL